jgi:hypothetical protein
MPTLTEKMQLASILSITCNIQHLAQQQSQCKLQYSMLQIRLFRKFRWENVANHQISPHKKFIKQMMPSAAWKQRESDPLGHCALYNPKRSLQPSNNEKCTAEAMKRQRNGLKMMLREKLLSQESELNMLR